MYSCKCKNRHAQTGEFCQYDINIESEVTIAGGYIRFNQSNLKISPITANITLSISTDQSEALILYSLDQFYNFVQMHLTDKYTFVLTLNNDRAVAQCEVKLNPTGLSNKLWTE